MTVAEAFAAPPPSPVQLSEKVVVVVTGAVVTGPPSGFRLPDQPELAGLAEAVQLVAPDAVHVRVTVAPELTVLLLAARLPVPAVNASSTPLLLD